MTRRYYQLVASLPALPDFRQATLLPLSRRRLEERLSLLHADDLEEEGLAAWSFIVGQVKPFYFGHPEQPLFGVYHEPDARKDVDLGVVLCPPTGHEAQAAYRSLRQLAVHLARAGFHVLRFDYFGTGDSAGESDEVDLERWRSDISVAIGELRDYSGVERISLVGLRVGAALAALAGDPHSPPHALVLWEPVVDGASYLKTLIRNYDEFCVEHGLPVGIQDGLQEAFGAALPDALCRQLRELNLAGVGKLAATRALVMDAAGAPSIALVEGLRCRGGATPEFRALDLPTLWETPNMSQPMVPMGALSSMVEWLSDSSR